MKRTINFDSFPWIGWPPPSALAPYFLAPKGKEWSYQGGNDDWGLEIAGLDGTDGRPEIDQVKVVLGMTGTPDFGVFLHYRKSDGRTGQALDYFSKGDVSRLREWLRTLQDDLRPIGLFIPYDQAWKAVKEFMERDGELPTSIAWIDGRDLPPGTFPDPGRFVPGRPPEPRVLRESDL